MAAEFRVYADSNRIFSTGPILNGSAPVSFDLDISGASTVKIESYSADGQSNLMKTDYKPRIIAANLQMYQ